MPFIHIQCAPLAHNIAYLAKSFGSIHLRHYHIRYSHYHTINPKRYQYSVKNPEVSKKEVNQSVNDAITNDVTSSPIDFSATIENSPLLVTTPLSDIPKDSALSLAVIPSENSFPSLPKHSTVTDNYRAILRSLWSTMLLHSLHSKQWKLAVQSSCDYVNCDPSSSLMAYLKRGRAWAVKLNSPRDFFASP